MTASFSCDDLASKGYLLVRNFLPVSSIPPDIIQSILDRQPGRSGVIQNLPKSLQRILNPFALQVFNSFEGLGLCLDSEVLNLSINQGLQRN